MQLASRAPVELVTTLPASAPPLLTGTFGPLERSLFLPIYAADLNDEEKRVALYLDKDAAVRWWHRGNVYPDFLLAALAGSEDRERVVVVETKGEQLAGNHDAA